MEETKTGSLVRLGALLSEPARARMLLSLMNGQRRPASELAQLGQVTPQTASGHLKLLVEGGALKMTPYGRHRYYGLASESWAEILESVMGLEAVKALPVPLVDAPLARARLCYRHLAGTLGVAWAEGLEREHCLEGAGARMKLSGKGVEALRRAGLLDADEVLSGLTAKPCLDWTERRHHLAGPLANTLTRRMLERRWLLPSRGSRVLLPTLDGERCLRRLGVQVPSG
jgi:DNA-binding transcriptional ArsR family regulator